MKHLIVLEGNLKLALKKNMAFLRLSINPIQLDL